jgi:hypothetical protein
MGRAVPQHSRNFHPPNDTASQPSVTLRRLESRKTRNPLLIIMRKHCILAYARWIQSTPSYSTRIIQDPVYYYLLIYA